MHGPRDPHTENPQTDRQDKMQIYPESTSDIVGGSASAPNLHTTGYWPVNAQMAHVSLNQLHSTNTDN